MPFVAPPGARIVHIGPHKTGTTSLQAALHDARASLAGQGVRYAGKDSKAADAVRAVRGVHAPSGVRPSMRHWTSLVREAEAAGDHRWVLSNEFLADAPDAAIETIVRDLGPERIQVVATLRPLARILTSQWQQYVQGGLSTAFEPWLREVLDAPIVDRPTGFWRRHRHHQLVSRWAAVAGSRRVTAIVVGEDPAGLLRTFSGLLGLDEGALRLEEDPRNRSMTVPEIEAVRAVNAAFRAAGVANSLHYRLIQRGAAERMKARRPATGEPRISLPSFALDRVAELSREIAEGIRASGVRVIGDLDSLTRVPAASHAADWAGEGTCVAGEIAAAMALGALEATGSVGQRRGAAPEPPELVGLPTRAIAAAVLRRPIGMVRRRLGSGEPGGA